MERFANEVKKVYKKLGRCVIAVSEGIADTLVIQQPGSPKTSWSPAETPYMVEPADALASRRHEAVVFVGPARTGKTASLLLGWMAHTVVNDPGDMLFVQMSKDKAREFSKTDVDRAIRYSPKVQAMKSDRAVDSNTFDTMFRHGMWVRIAWPTVGNVSGSTYRYVAITDIDRIENAENVDGEGPLFDLAKKRTTTFLSRGMTLVELLIAMALSLVVGAAIITVFTNSTRTFKADENMLRMQDDARRTIERMQAQGTDEVNKVLIPALEQLAAEQGYELVFDTRLTQTGGVLFYSTKLDVTDAFIAKVDELASAQ